MFSRFKLPEAVSVRSMRGKPAVGMANRSRHLAGRFEPVEVQKTDDEVDYQKKVEKELERVLATKFAGVTLSGDEKAKLRRTVAHRVYKSLSKELLAGLPNANFALRSGTSFSDETVRKDIDGRYDSDANFQTHQFDRGIGKGSSPLSDVSDGDQSHDHEEDVSAPRVRGNDDDGLNISGVAKIFQSFGISGDIFIGKQGRPGVSFGFLPGGRQFEPRRRTRQNWWVTNPDSLKLFLADIIENPRRGREAAKKAGIVLWWFYGQGQEDSEIKEQHPKLFKTIIEVESLRKRLFTEGYEMFGQSEDTFGMYKGRGGDTSWHDFRESLEPLTPAVQQRLQDHCIGQTKVDEQQAKIEPAPAGNNIVIEKPAENDDKLLTDQHVRALALNQKLVEMIPEQESMRTRPALPGA